MVGIQTQDQGHPLKEYHLRRVRVVVVTYNSADEVAECIDSIEKDDGVEICVIDNASSDGTERVLRQYKAEGKIDLLLLEGDNHGFARSVNRAIRTAATDADILLLNPDAALGEGVLRGLRERAAAFPSAGILSPLVRSGPSVRTTTAGRAPTLLPMLLHYSGVSQVMRKTRLLRGRYLYLNGKLDVVERVDWVAGCSMYIKREAIDRVGLLSERWFMYAEDTDYCRRVAESGLDVLMLTKLECYHEMGVSVKKMSKGVVNTMWPRSATDYYRHAYSPNRCTFFAWKLVFSAGLLSRAAVFALREKRLSSGPGESRRFREFAKAVWTVRG